MSIQPGAMLYTQGFGSRPENVEVPFITNRAPTSSDVNYPIGKRWIYLDNGEYILVEITASGGINTASWVLNGTNTGPLNTLTGNSGGAIAPSAGNINIVGSGIITVAGSGSTLTISETPGTGVVATLTGDSGGAVGPSGGNIDLNGTTNQIVTTGSGAGFDIVWSISSTLVLPGTFTANNGAALINSMGNSNTTIGNASGSGAVTINTPSGNFALTGNNNTINIAADASSSALNLGTGTTGNIALGNTGAGTITIAAGTATNLQGAVGQTITIGATAQTGKISIADSTAAMTAVDLMNGVAAGAQTLNIASGTSSTAAQTVNLLSGTTPGAITTLNVMGGVNSAGNQVVAVQGAAITQGTNTTTFFGGIATGGTNSFNIFNGAFTGGTNRVNIFSGAFTTVTPQFNLFSGASTSVGTTNIGTGTSAAHVTNIGSTAGGNVTIIAGSAKTIGIGLGGNAAQIITIGAAAQTGLITLGDSTATSTVAIASGTGTNTVAINNVASNANACVVDILNGATPAANQTVAIMTGSNSAGVQSFTVGSTAQTGNLAVINVGDTGALTVNTATQPAALKIAAAGGTYWGNQGSTPPAAGYIGQQIRSTVASGAAVVLTDDTAANVTSIALTAGIWDVTGIIIYTGTPTVDAPQNCTVGTTSATLGTSGDNNTVYAWSTAQFLVGDCSTTLPAYRLSLAATTTVYLVAQLGFTGGACSAYGRISATRVG